MRRWVPKAKEKGTIVDIYMGWCNGLPAGPGWPPFPQFPYLFTGMLLSLAASLPVFEKRGVPSWELRVR